MRKQVFGGRALASANREFATVRRKAASEEN
jgi:hypothetical protein